MEILFRLPAASLPGVDFGFLGNACWSWGLEKSNEFRERNVAKKVYSCSFGNGGMNGRVIAANGQKESWGYQRMFGSGGESGEVKICS